MSVNRSQEYLTKSYNNANGVHRPLPTLVAEARGSVMGKQPLAEKATEFVRRHPAPVLLGGFVIGGILGWLASRSR